MSATPGGPEGLQGPRTLTHPEATAQPGGRGLKISVRLVSLSRHLSAVRCETRTRHGPREAERRAGAQPAHFKRNPSSLSGRASCALVIVFWIFRLELVHSQSALMTPAALGIVCADVTPPEAGATRL